MSHFVPIYSIPWSRSLTVCNFRMLNSPSTKSMRPHTKIHFIPENLNSEIYMVICYTEQATSRYHRNPHSFLWGSILNKAVRQSQLKTINERPIMVPLNSLIKFINELSIRYSETKFLAYGGIFNAIKAHHLHFTLLSLPAGSLNRIK